MSHLTFDTNPVRNKPYESVRDQNYGFYIKTINIVHSQVAVDASEELTGS